MNSPTSNETTLASSTQPRSCSVGDDARDPLNATADVLENRRVVSSNTCEGSVSTGQTSANLCSPARSLEESTKRSTDSRSAGGTDTHVPSCAIRAIRQAELSDSSADGLRLLVHISVAR
eukprot:693256-Prorocentrum_minimum.AAC.44